MTVWACIGTVGRFGPYSPRDRPSADHGVGAQWCAGGCRDDQRGCRNHHDALDDQPDETDGAGEGDQRPASSVRGMATTAFVRGETVLPVVRHDRCLLVFAQAKGTAAIPPDL